MLLYVKATFYHSEEKKKMHFLVFDEYKWQNFLCIANTFFRNISCKNEAYES